MTITKKQFKLISLIPARFTDNVVELMLDFSHTTLSKTRIADAKIIDLPPGDTVEAFVRLIFDEEEGPSSNYITVYMCGDVLTSFLRRYGFIDICSAIRGRFKIEYRTTEEEDEYEHFYEVTAFILTELL